MKQVKINYKPYNLSPESILNIKRADLCHTEIISRRPFTGKTLQMIKDFYRIDTTWSSSALEGNSLTISETKLLIEEGITANGKPFKDALEIYGHSEAYDYMFTLIGNKMLSIDDICHFHQLLMYRETGETAGQYKTDENIITGSNYTTIAAIHVPDEMKKLENWMCTNRTKMHPIQFAAEVHRKLVYIHPFPDGNGRTARLAMNCILIQNGYLPCVISPAIKLDYINSLEAGRGGDYNAFLSFIAEAETETQKDFIRSMHMQMPNFKNLTMDHHPAP